MDLLAEKIVEKSRKPHQCDGCGRIFPKGSPFRVQTIADEGRIYNWRECPTCEALLAYYYDDNDEPREQGWASEMKSDDREEFEGDFEAYLAYLQRTYKPAAQWTKDRLWGYYARTRLEVTTPSGATASVTFEGEPTQEGIEAVMPVIEHCNKRINLIISTKWSIK